MWLMQYLTTGSYNISGGGPTVVELELEAKNSLKESAGEGAFQCSLRTTAVSPLAELFLRVQLF